MHEERGDHIGEQREGEPFQHTGDLVVMKADQSGDAGPENDDEQVRVGAGEHVRCVGHAVKIRADVDGVRRQQREHGHWQ